MIRKIIAMFLVLVFSVLTVSAFEPKQYFEEEIINIWYLNNNKYYYYYVDESSLAEVPKSFQEDPTLEILDLCRKSYDSYVKKLGKPRNVAEAKLLVAVVWKMAEYIAVSKNVLGRESKY